TTADSRLTVYLHPLTMVPEDDGVMVGRPDVGSYALFPPEGAQLLRLLAAGAPLPEAVGRYERGSGAALDVPDFLAALAERQFLRDPGQPAPAAAPVRWQRLGRAVFSPPAWACYLAVAVAAVAAMVGEPWLRPSYRNLFFTDYLSVIPLVLTPAGIGLVLVHE